jgi:hypothetical protein
MYGYVFMIRISGCRVHGGMLENLGLPCVVGATWAKSRDNGDVEVLWHRERLGLGLRFRVAGLEFRVKGLEFRVKGFKLRLRVLG